MKNKILNLIMAASIIICFGGCKKDELTGACKAGQDGFTLAFSPLKGSTDYTFVKYDFKLDNSATKVYYYYPLNGKVDFFIAIPQKNICTKSHLKVIYDVTIKNVPQPEPLKIYGEGYWSTFNEEVVLHDGSSAGGALYTGNKEFGLKEAFGDNAGDIELFLTVEFKSQGTEAKDQAYFEDHITFLAIDYDFDKSKP